MLNSLLKGSQQITKVISYHPGRIIRKSAWNSETAVSEVRCGDLKRPWEGCSSWGTFCIHALCLDVWQPGWTMRSNVDQQRVTEEKDGKVLGP